MRLLISLDYELFFGSKTGTVRNCLIHPVEALTRITDAHNIKLCLFVDAGYLTRCQYYLGQYPQLQGEYDAIRKHLEYLNHQGHDIQLHIHPHWEDTIYDGKNWQFSFDRYRLHDFNPAAMTEIVKRYKQVLTDIVGDNVFAYRAGGWCLQPFDQIADALYDNGVWLDSTVFYNGFSSEPKRWFNFHNTPQKSSWHFDQDPIVEDARGRFLQVPISSVKTGPLFFWKFLLSKIAKQNKHTSFGDGQPLRWTKAQYLKMLTQNTYSVATLDGLKVDLLGAAYKRQNKLDPDGILNIIGHPKAFSPYSLDTFDRFLQNYRFNSITYQSFRQDANTASE